VPAQLNPHVTISGTGAYLPERVIDNDTLAGMVQGYDAERGGDFGTWVDQVTHVHERRFCDWSVRSNDLALHAAQQALDVAGLQPSDLGLIVYASFTVSQDLPGDHCLFAEQLGATSTPVFHLKAACAGSVYGLGVAWSMVASGMYEHVLVIGTETPSKALNFHDPITSIIFGDGAGAAIVSRRDGTKKGDEGGGMLPPHLGFRYSPRNIQLANSNIPMHVARFPDREIEPGVPLVEQALVEMESGPNVLRSAVMAMAEMLTACLGYEPRALRKKDPALLETIRQARVVPHQANGRIIDGLADRLRIPHERVVRTIYRYGNMSAASNLVALDYGLRYGNMARELDEDGKVIRIVDHEEQRFQPGELVLLPSIGGGYLMGCAGFVVEQALLDRTRAQMATEPATA